MVNAVLYIEGGGDSKELHSRLREAFRKLLEKCGFNGRMPRLVACGGRGRAFDNFRTALEHATGGENQPFIGLLIDSEDPLDPGLSLWTHLRNRDGWERPDKATEDQLLLMVTCMETWIVADHDRLDIHYGDKLQKSALPALHALEQRNRHDIQDGLARATHTCTNAYTKGKRSFDILAKLEPDTLERHLPGFKRIRQILNTRL